MENYTALEIFNTPKGKVFVIKPKEDEKFKIHQNVQIDGEIYIIKDLE